jgi:hypothetical protein
MEMSSEGMEQIEENNNESDEQDEDKTNETMNQKTRMNTVNKAIIG